MQPFAAHREIHLQPESALHKKHQRQPVSRDATFMYSAATTNQRVCHETQIHFSRWLHIAVMLFCHVVLGGSLVRGRKWGFAHSIIHKSKSLSQTSKRHLRYRLIHSITSTFFLTQSHFLNTLQSRRHYEEASLISRHRVPTAMVCPEDALIYTKHSCSWRLTPAGSSIKATV